MTGSGFGDSGNINAGNGNRSSGNSGKSSTGFSRLNNMYRSPGSATPYKWNGQEVVLPLAKFDQDQYLDMKLQLLQARVSEIPEENRRSILENTVRDNAALLFELSTSVSPEFEKLDKRFDFLIESTFANAEHEYHVKKSREKITNSRSDNGWMSPGGVDDLVRLNRVIKVRPTDSRKFVPKDRR